MISCFCALALPLTAEIHHSRPRPLLFPGIHTPEQWEWASTEPQGPAMPPHYLIMSPVCWCSAARAGAAPGQSRSNSGHRDHGGLWQSQPRQRVAASQEIPSPPGSSLSPTVLSPGCPGHQEPGWHGQGRAVGLSPCEQHGGNLLEHSMCPTAGTASQAQMLLHVVPGQLQAPPKGVPLGQQRACVSLFLCWELPCPRSPLVSQPEELEPPPASPPPLLRPSHG